MRCRPAEGVLCAVLIMGAVQSAINHSAFACCCVLSNYGREMARDCRVCSGTDGRPISHDSRVSCVRTFSPLEAVTNLRPLSTATSLQVRSDQDSFRPSRGAEPPGSPALRSPAPHHIAAAVTLRPSPPPPRTLSRTMPYIRSLSLHHTSSSGQWHSAMCTQSHSAHSPHPTVWLCPSHWPNLLSVSPAQLRHALVFRRTSSDVNQQEVSHFSHSAAPSFQAFSRSDPPTTQPAAAPHD